MNTTPNSDARGGVAAIRPDSMAWVLFLLGSTNGVSLNFVGEIYFVELALLPVAAIAFVISRNTAVIGNGLFWSFVIACFLTFLGYVISDLYVGTRPDQYFRGWARIGFLVINIAAFGVIGLLAKKSIWWYLLGAGVGVLVYKLVSGVPLTVWKIGYGAPISLIVLTTALLFPHRIGVALIAGIGALSVYLDSRVHGALILLVAAVTWAKLGRNEFSMRVPLSRTKLAVASLATTLGIAGLLTITDEDYAQRRESSNVGREAGILVGIQAILRSPFVGYGSWTENADLAKMVVETIKENEGARHALQEFGTSGKYFSPHSIILQSWVEGGALGAVVFILYGVFLVRCIYWYIFERPVDVFTPVFFYMLTSGLWHLLASHFGGEARIEIAATIGIILVTMVEIRGRRDHALPGAQNSTTLRQAPAVHRQYDLLQRKRDSNRLR